MDISYILTTFGYLGILSIVFAESGLLIGFFLPGDTLLFGAGILASQDKVFNIAILIPLLFLAAVTGDSVGYSFGHRVGRKLFTKKSFLFHHENLEKAEQFYEKHGKWTIVLARFVPIIRTFAPVVAGIGKMNYRTFLSYNLIGGLLWTGSVTLLGYFLGGLFPDLEHYITPVIVIIVLISMISPIVHVFSDKTQRELIFKWFKSKLKLKS
jgi:membrane-associated protein